MNPDLNHLDIWVITITTVASLRVIWYCVNEINVMDNRTIFPIRFAYIAMAVASAAIILCPDFYRVAPQHSEAALIVAIAILTIFSRRKSTFY